MKIKHLLSALAFSGLMATPTVAENLSEGDLGFAFDTEEKSELNAVNPNPSGVEFMTEEEMIATEGEGYNFSWDLQMSSYYHSQYGGL